MWGHYHSPTADGVISGGEYGSKEEPRIWEPDRWKSVRPDPVSDSIF